MMANRYSISFFLFLIYLVLSSPLYSQVEAGKKHPVPNPLELSQDWWKYFDVPNDLLQERIGTFRQELLTLQKNLKKDEHQQILKSIDQVLLMLELVAQRRKELKPSEQSEVQLLQHYSFAQFLTVYKRLQKTKQEINAHQRKIDMFESRLARIQSTLDRSILHYRTLNLASYDRLFEGMEIVKLRTEYALHHLDLENERSLLNYLVKESHLLSEELSTAQERLSLEDGITQEINHDLQKSQHSLAKAKEELFKLEKKASLKSSDGNQEEFYCCLVDNQVLAQSVVVENFNVQVIIDKIKLMLVSLLKNHKEADSSDVQTLIAEWRKVLDIAHEQHDYWLRQIKEDQSQVSRMTAQALQKNEERSHEREDLVGKIHFELDKSLAELEILEMKIQISEFLLRRVEYQLVQKKSFLQTWAITLKSFWYEFTDSLINWGQYTLFRIKEHPITIMTVVKALLIVIGAFLASHYLKKMLIKRRIVVRAFSKSTEYIVLRLIHYLIIIFGFLIALSFIGLDFTNLAIVAGALGVGIGFGLQTIVSNISSGFMLLLKKYIKVGDIIELPSKDLGTITAVNLQNTIIRTFDGAEVMLPNSQLSTQQLTNWTMKDNVRRFRIPFGVAYSADKDLVRDSVIDAVKQLPFVHTNDFRYPDPQVWLVEFGDSSVKFELVAWVDMSVPVPYETSRSALMWTLDNALKQNGIKIPFPQRDVHIKEYSGK